MNNLDTISHSLKTNYKFIIILFFLIFLSLSVAYQFIPKKFIIRSSYIIYAPLNEVKVINKLSDLNPSNEYYYWTEIIKTVLASEEFKRIIVTSAQQINVQKKTDLETIKWLNLEKYLYISHKHDSLIEVIYEHSEPEIGIMVLTNLSKYLQNLNTDKILSKYRKIILTMDKPEVLSQYKPNLILNIILIIGLAIATPIYITITMTFFKS